MTILTSSPVQIFSSFVIFLGGMALAFYLSRKFKVARSRALLLYFWHTFFSFVYIAYVLNFGGDATMYFHSSFSNDLSMSLGTGGVRFFVHILTQVFGLSFLGCSLFFQTFGFVGLLAFDAALRDVTSQKLRKVRLLATFIVFLPSVSFWSSGLGKDSLSFFSVGLALWAALDMRKRWWLLVVSTSMMLLVRPHMAGMLGLGMAGSFLLQRGIPVAQRVLFGGMAIAASASMVPLGLNYAGVSSDAGAIELIEYIGSRQSHNLTGGGAVDISSMSLPFQLFTYLFRPTLVEVRDIFSLAAALDNLVLLGLFVLGGWALLKKPLPTHLLSHNRAFLWIYSGAAWVILAMTTANLGIALRQKWMFAPMLIFLFISVIGKDRFLTEDDASVRRPRRLL